MFRINAKFVRDFLFKRGLSLREFATAAQINALTAAKITRDGATVTAKILAKLAAFLNVDGDELTLKG